ncbi:uncharacterized protein LOC123903122 isoform X2 [Trifolium pratense]|uniref:uncharacterized protein LOC123903122 isoform X2 n=1 Tax=Trifolium pratense TaxID=57577 RepID=UPI001E69242E|nr:uncharacterized protein LOC123903122 isoform X2 [Trifolium pratense]
MKNSPNKRSNPKNDATKKTSKRQKEVGTHSVHVTQQISETHNKEKTIEIHILSSSSNPTKTAGKDNRDDKQDNDSTASSPVVKQRDHSRRFPATERKTRKSNILETLRASSSAPPKSNLKGRTDDRDFKEIRKNLFCRPDEEDDSDFYLNYHPAASIGYEGLDINFHIPSWMSMTFKPTAAMNLNDLCAYTAAYIFKADPEQLFGDEVLVRTTSGVIGDRQAPKSLMPRYPVDQQIINLVVARQNWVMSILLEE